MNRNELIAYVLRLEGMFCEERTKLFERNGAKQRIACVDCDTEDADGISIGAARKVGWTGLQADCTADADELLRWWTVLGTCPRCKAEQDA